MKKLEHVYAQVQELSMFLQFNFHEHQELPRVRKLISDAHSSLVDVGINIQLARNLGPRGSGTKGATK